MKVLCFLDDTGVSEIQVSIIKELQKKYKKIEFSLIDGKNDGELNRKYNIKELPSIIIEDEGIVKARFSGLTQKIFLERALEQLIK